MSLLVSLVVDGEWFRRTLGSFAARVVSSDLAPVCVALAATTRAARRRASCAVLRQAASPLPRPLKALGRYEDDGDARALYAVYQGMLPVGPGARKKLAMLLAKAATPECYAALDELWSSGAFPLEFMLTPRRPSLGRWIAAAALLEASPSDELFQVLANGLLGPMTDGDAPIPEALRAFRSRTVDRLVRLAPASFHDPTYLAAIHNLRAAAARIVDEHGGVDRPSQIIPQWTRDNLAGQVAAVVGFDGYALATWTLACLDGVGDAVRANEDEDAVRDLVVLYQLGVRMLTDGCVHVQHALATDATFVDSFLDDCRAVQTHLAAVCRQTDANVRAGASPSGFEAARRRTLVCISANKRVAYDECADLRVSSSHRVF